MCFLFSLPVAFFVLFFIFFYFNTVKIKDSVQIFVRTKVNWVEVTVSGLLNGSFSRSSRLCCHAAFLSKYSIFEKFISFPFFCYGIFLLVARDCGRIYIYIYTGIYMYIISVSIKNTSFSYFSFGISASLSLFTPIATLGSLLTRRQVAWLSQG